MLIVAITGMPGAGKSTAAKALEAHGFARITMGDVIREETRRRGLEPDEKNTGKVMLELREQYGPGAVAEVCVRSLKASKESVVIVDGIRSYAEVEVFAREGRVKLLAISASRDRRFKLLRERARSDAPATRAGFDERDKRELSIGVGNALALADESLSNERATPEELGNKAVELVEWWVSTTG
ncbi:MAG TPA: AAA family ATPase [Nitrososphaerales archaeon]|nr:AAA family ATPase [Nitrososphaerales archaeon]